MSNEQPETNNAVNFDIINPVQETHNNVDDLNSVTNTGNDNLIDEDEFSEQESELGFNDLDIPTTWAPSGEMSQFPTNIHKGKTLSKEQRSSILRNEPRNANIKYNPPAIDKRI
ncbi:3817_t:CDS:1 [Racocetra persica]|uniref:3817_t:CDS:1 n=1 Tax=Racocetra persica TaxID=160502 RepID=A0ACA9L6X8_9GLOM|nr:3817_t:CDS:1 [Racocetra persica]